MAEKYVQFCMSCVKEYNQGVRNNYFYRINRDDWKEASRTSSIDVFDLLAQANGHFYHGHCPEHRTKMHEFMEQRNQRIAQEAKKNGV